MNPPPLAGPHRAHHLCFVANVSRLQRQELVAAGVPTLEALGAAPLPPSFRPRRGARASYERAYSN